MVFLATTGQQATEVKVLVPPEEAVYHGEVKSFNPNKGYGFIGCDAFPGQDVFVLKSEMPGGFAPQGGHCKFKVKQESEKGPAATEVQLLGTAGNQYQQMEHMAFYSGSKGFSKAKDTFWQDLQAQTLRLGEYQKMTEQAVEKLRDDPELKDFFEDVKKILILDLKFQSH
ncbi:unnamed protein product [Durusdinium trenchii]|uniref:CSD domain-containing protein n=1 Tax=Durusdinium trenchii TaxID=1381693 RepID=A0ABP0PR73_9DINO